MSWQQQPYNQGYGQQQPPPQTTPSYNPAYSSQSLPPGRPAQPQWQQQPPGQSIGGYNSPPGGSGYSGAPPTSTGYGRPPPGGTGYAGGPVGGAGYGRPPPRGTGYAGGPAGGTGYTGGPAGGAGYAGGPAGGTGYTGGPAGRGGYGGPPPAAPPQDQELLMWFQAVDKDQSGRITSIELREALLNSNWSHFNSETCRLLIGMFDRDGDGTIDFSEFAALWKYVQEWKSCFSKFDKDGSGNIDAYELQQALLSFGYRLSTEFCNLCTRVFDRSDKRTMKFDDFIQCCVMLRSLTDSFKKLDTNKSGVININYEQFLQMAIDNTIR